MTSIRAIREGLGLTGDELASILGVEPRTVRRWESADRTPSSGVWAEVEALEAEAARQVAGDPVPDHRPDGWRRAIAFRQRSL